MNEEELRQRFSEMQERRHPRMNLSQLMAMGRAAVEPASAPTEP